MNKVIFLISNFIITILINLQTVCAYNSVKKFTISGTITNIIPGKTVYVAMYSSSDNFDKLEFYKKLRFLDEQVNFDTLYYSFSNVEKGEYIIAAYQDLNSDGKLNMGFFGPLEPYRVFKTNYIFKPKFTKCKFLVENDMDSLNIILK